MWDEFSLSPGTGPPLGLARGAGDPAMREASSGSPTSSNLSPRNR